MQTTGKISRFLLVLGAALLLAGCGTQGPDARPAFGYSGLPDGTAGISTYEQAKADFLTGRFGLAVKRFQLAMAEDPASVEAINGLAASYDRIGRFDLAQRFYRRALTMDPHSVQTLNNLGYSLLLQGKPDLAVALLDDANRHAPGHSVITANAAMAAAALGDEGARQPASAPQAASYASAEAVGEAAAGRIVRVSTAVQRLQLAAQPLMPVDVQPLPALPKPGDVAAAPQPVAVLPTVREAAATSGPARTLIVTPPQELTASDGSVEVANGTGRRHMAARMQAYLLALGLPAQRLSNADHFAHARTTITYRRGHQGLAEVLAASLPVAPQLRQVAGQAADVRLQLGGGLLEFDRGLLQAERNRSDADAI